MVDSGDLSALNQYHSVLNELELLDREAAKAAKIQTRTKWTEEGERSTAFFLRLGKKNKANKMIDLILNNKNQYVTEPAELRQAWFSFYKDLFSSQETDEVLTDEFISTIERRLPSEVRDICEGLLSTKECFEALGGMPSGKSPGLDGLPKEFYLKFWKLIGEDLVSVLNYAHSCGVLSVSQRRGIISLSHKKGERFLMKNWRPISLLCTDYKIASRAITCRLRKVIEHVVSPDQTCSVPGRYIGENIRLLQDAVTYANMTNSPLALVSLDQEKAFDRVEWSYMLRVLEGMRFGPSFCRWVRLFYTGPQSSVLVNGFFTPFINLSRGVRQGCPLSAPLYVLIAESLACRIRSSIYLRGLPLPDSDLEPALISQYADDTTLLCTDDDEISTVFSIYEDYEKASGAKINKEKSKGLWTGSWKGRSDPPIELQWNSDNIPCLGTCVGNGDYSHLIWDNRLNKFSDILDSWKNRNLSFSGKTVVLNTLAMAGLWFCVSVLAMPNWVLTHVSKRVLDFFWSGKKHLVAQNTLFQPADQGGFGLIDIHSKVRALHCQWIKRWAVSPSKWCAFFACFVKNAFGDEIRSVLSYPAYYPSHLLPDFYASLLDAWAYVGGHFSAQLKTFSILQPSDGSTMSISSLTTKSIYWNIIERNFVLPNCVSKFRPIFGDLYWTDTWSQANIMPLDRQVRDLAWKISHGVLYTCDRLVKFGMNIADTSCFCTHPLETPEHLFFECNLMQELLLWAQSIFLRVTPLSPSLQPRHMLFGYDSHERQVVPPVFSYLLNLLKYFVWLARNEYRFEDTLPVASVVKIKVAKRLNIHLRCYSKRFTNRRSRRFFNRSWNVLGKFSPDITFVTWPV